jgi:hypothetical protein
MADKSAAAYAGQSAAKIRGGSRNGSVSAKHLRQRNVRPLLANTLRADLIGRAGHRSREVERNRSAGHLSYNASGEQGRRDVSH